MTVVIDASLLVSLAANDPRAEAVEDLPITFHQLRDAPPVIRLARQLERHSAYDAAYLKLSQELGATCWTLDGRPRSQCLPARAAGPAGRHVRPDALRPLSTAPGPP
jgi:predicted nucleic acid-binding protein